MTAMIWQMLEIGNGPWHFEKMIPQRVPAAAATFEKPSKEVDVKQAHHWDVYAEHVRLHGRGMERMLDSFRDVFAFSLKELSHYDKHKFTHHQVGHTRAHFQKAAPIESGRVGNGGSELQRAAGCWADLQIHIIFRSSYRLTRKKG